MDSMPLNMSLLGSSNLLLRGFFLNNSLASNGRDGLESFLDVYVAWSRGSDQAAGGGGSGISAAAVVVPVVVGSLGLLAAIGLLVVLRRRKRKTAAAPGAAPHSRGKPTKGLLPKVHADVSSHSCASDATDGSHGSGKIEAGLCSSVGQLDRTISGLSGSNNSRAMSGPGQDIIQATRDLVLQKTAGDVDELVLMSVLGEGSYGKVRGDPGVTDVMWFGGSCCRSPCSRQ